LFGFNRKLVPVGKSCGCYRENPLHFSKYFLNNSKIYRHSLANKGEIYDRSSSVIVVAVARWRCFSLIFRSLSLSLIAIEDELECIVVGWSLILGGSWGWRILKNSKLNHSLKNTHKFTHIAQ
jgi:hypothetical protein